MIKHIIAAFFPNVCASCKTIIDKDEYYIKYTTNYEIRVGGNRKPSNSKVESFIIKKYEKK